MSLTSRYNSSLRSSPPYIDDFDDFYYPFRSRYDPIDHASPRSLIRRAWREFSTPDHHRMHLRSPSSSSSYYRDFPEFGREIIVPTTRDDKFHLSLDFHEFDPADISVKVEDDTVVIKAKRERKSGSSGSGSGSSGGLVESREYVQRFTVPENVLADRMTCLFDKSGYLRIEAPLRPEERPPQFDRTIPVEVVHKPALK